MKSRPMPFTDDSVNAIRAGHKTETRRLLKAKAGAINVEVPLAEQSPYGVPGDQLWVKETHAYRTDIDGSVDPEKARHYTVYRADKTEFSPSDPHNWHNFGGRWRSPRYMPRWASRLTLEVTSIRVERLQEIDELGALAEGVEGKRVTGTLDGVPGEYVIGSARDGYIALWDTINAERAPWVSNPMVWVVGFKVLHAG